LTYTHYLPPEIYRSLMNIAHDRGLSIKEVECAFLRYMCKEFGHRCKHEFIDFAKSNGLPYCKGCYQRMKMTEPRTYRGSRLIKEGKYEEIKDLVQETEILK